MIWPETIIAAVLICGLCFLAGMRAATTLHRGPYRQLKRTSDAYELLRRAYIDLAYRNYIQKGNVK